MSMKSQNPCLKFQKSLESLLRNLSIETSQEVRLSSLINTSARKRRNGSVDQDNLSKKRKITSSNSAHSLLKFIQFQNREGHSRQKWQLEKYLKLWIIKFQILGILVQILHCSMLGLSPYKACIPLSFLPSESLDCLVSLCIFLKGHRIKNRFS